MDDVLARLRAQADYAERGGQPPTTPAVRNSEAADAIERLTRERDARGTCTALACKLIQASKADDIETIGELQKRAAKAEARTAEREAEIRSLASHLESALARAERYRKVLAWYAEGEHFRIADRGAWDTVSGEPPNWLDDSAGTASVEDGWFAKRVIEDDYFDVDRALTDEDGE